MTSEQFKRVTDNQIIIDRKLDKIINELERLKKDINVSINNQILLEEYQIDIVKRLKKIESK